MLRDHAQAEEVAQEAYLDAWRNANRFEAARGSALAWLLTITHRKAVDRVRSSQSSRNRDTAYQQDDRPDEHDTTAEAVVAASEAGRVRAALTRLTRTQRESIELAYFGGHTHSQVATLLDIPLGTAKTRIRDGLQALRVAMTDPSPPGTSPA